jgi:excisionase family DNA binding protein
METTTQAKFLTVRESAEYLRVSRSYLYKLAEARQLTFFRVGSRLLFSPDDLNEWLRSRRVEAVA